MICDRFNSPRLRLLPPMESGGGRWNLAIADTLQPCGTLNFSDAERTVSIEIDSPFRGLGFATEALAVWLPTALESGHVLTEPLAENSPGSTIARNLGFEQQPNGMAWKLTAEVAALDKAADWQSLYVARVRQMLASLDLDPESFRARGLPMFTEAAQLTQLPPDRYSRTPWLTHAAADAWSVLKASAASDGISIEMISAFRSYRYQQQLVRRKIEGGQPAEEVFAVSAAPGFSEHHTGTAVDIADPTTEPLEEAFEGTEAFAWLQQNAASNGFTMSYPRNNSLGMLYEPWHWRFGADSSCRITEW